MRQERNKEPVCGVKADWVKLEGGRAACVCPAAGKNLNRPDESKLSSVRFCIFPPPVWLRHPSVQLRCPLPRGWGLGAGMLRDGWRKRAGTAEHLAKLMKHRTMKILPQKMEDAEQAAKRIRGKETGLRCFLASRKNRNPRTPFFVSRHPFVPAFISARRSRRQWFFRRLRGRTCPLRPCFFRRGSGSPHRRCSRPGTPCPR